MGPVWIENEYQMAGTMRRDDREITNCLEIESILHHAIVCRIGLADGDEPHIVPVSFGYEDRTIYFHSADYREKNLDA